MRGTLRWGLALLLCAGLVACGPPEDSVEPPPQVMTPTTSEQGPTSTATATASPATASPATVSPTAAVSPTAVVSPAAAASPAVTASVTPGPTATPSIAGESPAVWVGARSTGELVVLDSASGEVLRTLATFDDPDDFGGAGQEPIAGATFPDSVALSPDRQTVYLSLCCEPAPGRLARIPIVGGEVEEIGFGYAPDVSPDGTRIAYVELQWLSLMDLASGETVRVMGDDADVAALASVAWTLDGVEVLVERYLDTDEAPELFRVTPGSAASLDDAEVVPLPDGVSGTLPAIHADGRLLVVDQASLFGDDLGPARVLAVDLASTEVEELVVAEQGFFDLALDASRHHAILVRDDEVVLGLGPDGVVELGQGFVAAAW